MLFVLHGSDAACGKRGRELVHRLYQAINFLFGLFFPNAHNCLHSWFWEVKMSALYAMRYVGQIGMGAGAIYIGKGLILGADVAGGRYNGDYTEQNGRLHAKATMSYHRHQLLTCMRPAAQTD